MQQERGIRSLSRGSWTRPGDEQSDREAAQWDTFGRKFGCRTGRGFRFTLPLADPSVTTALSIKQPCQSERRQVLLIEDNRDAADVLAELIRLMGCEIEVAYDGWTGLALAHEIRPDPILCDVGLSGGMDGYALAREARADRDSTQYVWSQFPAIASQKIEPRLRKPVSTNSCPSP